MVNTVSKKSVKRTLLVIAAVWCFGVVSLAGLFWYFNSASKTALTLQPNDSAPMFTLTDQDGRTHSLHDYAGRAVALVFIPDTKQESARQLRSLNQNIRQFDTLGVKLFAVAPSDAPAAKRLHDGEGLQFPILYDGGQKVARQYCADTDNDPDRRVSYVIGRDARVILPIAAVNAAEHGKQLSELAECCLDSRPVPNSKLIGKPIVDFKLPRASDGQPESLYGETRRKATVIFITSAECPCSGKYESRMEELAKAYSGQGVRFVALNSSFGETPQMIADHAKKAGFSFPVLKDESNLIADRIEARVTPEAFVMDSKGILRYHGRIDDCRDERLVQSHDLRNALDFLLAGKNPTRPDVVAFGCAILRAPTKAGS